MSFRLLIFLMLIQQFAFSQNIRSLDYYKNSAHENNPALLENKNLQQFNNLQNNITLAQFRKPQINITADYLFAPFFFNYGRFISITQNPTKDAYGYDVNLSNGSLYAGQLNAALPLFSGGIIKSFNYQNSVQNEVLKNINNQLVHDLDNNITNQYITIYQIQQLLTFQETIILHVEDRKKIQEVLVQKGLSQQNEYLLLDIELKQRRFDVQQLKIKLYDAFSSLNNTCLIQDSTTYIVDPPTIPLSAPRNQYNFQKKFELDSTEVIARQEVFNIKYRPQLTAYGNAGLNSSTTENIAHNTGISAGLHLLIPIYDGGQKKTVVEQNKLLLENSRNFLKQNSILIENNLAALQQQINLTRQSLEMIDSELLTQETLLQILKDKVVTGQISVTDYLIALQNYETSNQNKIQTRTNLWLLINKYNYYNW